MSATTMWNEEQEQRRQGYLQVGLTPKLYHYWADCSTDSLRLSLEEYQFKAPTLLADVIEQLQAEIAYRSIG